MIPIIPHFAYECLEANNFELNKKWPEYNKELLIDDDVNIVIQINGKKRGLIKAKRDIPENELLTKIKENQNIDKYLNNKKEKKIIFIKNRIINIII